MNLDLGDTRRIIEEGKRRGLLRNQLAYVLATAYLETARTMRPVEEAFWLSDDWRRRNLRYYPWHGRGYVQLTWKHNYKKASRKTGVDLIANPKAAMHPDVAAKVLVLGMIEGWFTGRKLSDYITLHKSDFYNARRIVNAMDKARQFAQVAERYDEALLRERYGVTPPDVEPLPPKPSGLWAALVALFNSIFGRK